LAISRNFLPDKGGSLYSHKIYCSGSIFRMKILWMRIVLSWDNNAMVFAGTLIFTKNKSLCALWLLVNRMHAPLEGRVKMPTNF